MAHLVAIGVAARADRAAPAIAAVAPEEQYRRLLEVAREGLILVTCERIEIIALVDGPCPSARLARVLGVESDDPSAARFVGVDAVRHLARVAAGLESTVLGEAEILGQVRRAGERARALGAIGPTIEQALAAALRAGRRARVETRLGRGAASLVGAALDLASRTVGDLDGRSALVIGAGQLGAELAETLLTRGAVVTIVNRSVPAAEALASRLGVAVRELADLAGLLERSDLTVVAAGPAEPIVTREHLAALATRDAARTVVVDLGRPSAVAEPAGPTGSLVIHRLAQVQAHRQAAEAGRLDAVPAAQAIVESEVVRFQRWQQRRAVSPIIAALVRRGAEIRDHEIARFERNAATPAGDPRLVALADRIVARLLDVPLRRLASAPDGTALAQTAARLFDLAISPSGSES